MRRPTFGPGIVFVVAVTGTGDFVSNAAAGASHGYSLLWSLALALVFRYVVLEASARYVLVMGEGLLQGYAQIGRWLLWAFLFIALARRHTGNLYEVVFMGSTIDLLLPLPIESSATVWSLICVAAGFGIMLVGKYEWIERLCKVLIAVLGIALLAAAVASKPDMSAVLKGALLPNLGSTGLYDTFLLIAAIMGAEIGMRNITYAYFVQEKGWRDPSCMGRQRIDLILSVSVLFMMGASIQVAAAGVLGSQGVDVETPEDLVRILSEPQGAAGRILFAVGLWAASFSTFAIAAVGYGIAMTDALRSCLPYLKKWPRPAKGSATKDPVYRAFVTVFALSPLYVFLTDIKPVALVLLANALLVPAIPLLTYGLLRITSDRKRMGPYTNSVLTNVVLASLAAVTIYLAYQNGLNWWALLATAFGSA